MADAEVAGRASDVQGARVLQWEEARAEVLALAGAGELVPFVGAGISLFKPTGLPAGRGLLHSTLRGAFTDPPRFQGPPETWSAEERRIDELAPKQTISPEVILQGLFEALPDRARGCSPYDGLVGAAPNALHVCLATALAGGAVPAILTTNPDDCIERAALDPATVVAAYRPDHYGPELLPRVYHLHGLVSEPESADRAGRLASLTNTLNSMGRRLPDHKAAVLAAASRGHSLLFIGYSGSDPDIWYSLTQLLAAGTRQVYWCVRSPGDVTGHLGRLVARHADRITVVAADLTSSALAAELGEAWGYAVTEGLVVAEAEAQARSALRIEQWLAAVALSAQEQQLAYGWLLVQVGLFARGAEVLIDCGRAATDPWVRMMATLLAGYAYRERSMHRDAQAYLRRAIRLAEQGHERVRALQARHKLAESRGSFERLRLSHFLPDLPCQPARELRRVIRGYEELERDETWGPRLTAQALGRAGKGNAMMNLGQVYRRVYAMLAEGPLRLPVPPYRRGQELWLGQAFEVLTEEGDMRALAMAFGAGAGGDTAEEAGARLATAVEYAEHWNQDLIQIGSAHYGLAEFLKPNAPAQAVAQFKAALESFVAAGMQAEIARTCLELWLLLRRDADSLDEAYAYRCQGLRALAACQGSWTWKRAFPVIMHVGRGRRS